MKQLCRSNLGKDNILEILSLVIRSFCFSLFSYGTWQLLAMIQCQLEKNTVHFLNTLKPNFFPCPSSPELLIFLIHTYPVANNV